MLSSWANEREGAVTKSRLPGARIPTARREPVRPLSGSPFLAYDFESSVPASIIENPFAIRGSLQTLPPISLKLVDQSPAEMIWDQLVRRHHYLGYQNLLGHRLKYLALMSACPVAALSFSAPGLKVEARDQFIGWSKEQRQQYLPHVANNSRFLIIPGVQVPHLASHVLSLAIAQLRQDWGQHFQTPLSLQRHLIKNKA